MRVPTSARPLPSETAEHKRLQGINLDKLAVLRYKHGLTWADVFSADEAGCLFFPQHSAVWAPKGTRNVVGKKDDKRQYTFDVVVNGRGEVSAPAVARAHT
jgi:hypothetical protein